MPSRFAKIIERNWPAKIISVAAAIILFLFYRATSLEERFFSVPLDIRINESYAVSSTLPSSVKVTLRGSEDNIFLVLEDDIEVYADFTVHAAEGQFLEPVKFRKTGSAQNIENLEIRVEPSEIKLELERKIARSVKIQPQLTGYPEKGYELDQYLLSTEEALVEGPASHVQELEIIPTEELNLDGRVEDFYVRLSFDVKDPYLSFPAGDSVGFQGVITETTILKTFEDVGIIFIDLPSDLDVESEEVSGTIKVQGRQLMLESTSSEDFSLLADCSSITSPGEHEIAVRPLVPPGAAVLRFSPETIILKAERID